MNACTPNPCLHNGVCKKIAKGGFDCTCHGNYDGKTCQCKYYLINIRICPMFSRYGNSMYMFRFACVVMCLN